MHRTKISAVYLIIGLFTFIGIFVSIVLKSYDNLMGPTKKIQSKEVIQPIDTNLDVATIKIIEDREELTSSTVASP